MNFLGTICDGFRRIFTGENVLAKHLSLFAIIGFYCVVNMMYFETSKYEGTPDFSAIVIGFIVMIICNLYLNGYSLSFMHNSFNDNETDLLPEVDEKPFGICFGAFPLYVVWSLWIVLSFLIAIIPILGQITFLVMLIIWYPFITFIYTAYAKDFDAEGLYNFTLPFEFMKASFGTVVAFYFWCTLVCILVAIPIVVAIFIIGFVSEFSKVMFFASSVLCGYCYFIVGMVCAYCMVQVYREKIEANMD